jgi:anti-sigma factor RsiW
MTHAAARDRLDDFVDGSLAAAERSALEAHLARCAECSAEVAALRSLLAAAGELPAGVAPARDLWPDVEQRLQPAGAAPPPQRQRWLPALGVAAAVTVLAAAAWLSQRGRTGAPQPLVPAGAPALQANLYLPAMIWALERECAGAAKQLRASVGQHDFPGGPAAAATLSQGLAALDDSIVETLAALAREPADSKLVRRLALRYQQKLALLNDAIQLVEEA